jgi:dTDP-4-amino-4,6-dideoxygalactose transaminase
VNPTDKKSFSGIIPIARPWFSEEEEKLVAETLRSAWVAQGPKVKAFEQAVADYVGSRFAIATNSCTSALQVALEILGVGPGDEVIAPSFTFIATANGVIHCGGRPVFVDIDARTYNLDPAAIESAITPRTKVILAVNQIGLPADLDAIQSIAVKKGLHVLEDAACALGSEYKGRKIGSISEISCFSFHPRKLITTGEGGMITTRDPEYAEAARVKVSHGASVSDLARHQSPKIIFEEYPVHGYNFRMSDLQAAVGLGQMKKLGEILEKKRFFAERYNQTFSQVPEVACPFEPEGYKTNFQSYMIRILPSAKRTRDEIMQELLKKGVSTRRGITAVHLEPVYQKLVGHIRLPETERAFQETMILPLYPQMTVEEQDYVIESLKDAIFF